MLKNGFSFPPFLVHYSFPRRRTNYFTVIGIDLCEEPFLELENPFMLKDLGVDRILDSLSIYFLTVVIHDLTVFKLMIPEQRCIIKCHIEYILVEVMKRFNSSDSSIKRDLYFERGIYDEISRLIEHEISPGIFK
jgi:hypothetical protein